MRKYILIIAVVAVCLSFASCKGTDRPTETDPITTAILPDPIVTTENPVVDDTTDVPVITEAPVTDPPITDAPATEAVTEEVTTVVKAPHQPGRALGSGYVISDSGTKLNLLLNWSAVDGEQEGTAVITVKLYLECYSIFVGERYDGEISIGDTKIGYNTPQLEIPGSGFNEIDFGTYTFTVNKSDASATTLPISASWHFRGVYAGLSVDFVTINSNISFSN